MFIILRYLSKQLLISMIAVAGILLLIFMSGRFIKYLADAAAGQLSADVLFAIMGYRLPGFLELILPLGMFIGILLAYGRMYLESEMTVLFACGMTKWQLIKLTMATAGLVSLLVGFMSLYLSPWGMQQVEQIFVDQSKMTEFEMLVPGRFQSLRSGERVTYTEALSDDKREMQNVFIAERDEAQGSIAVLAAQRGTQLVDDKTGSRFIVLHQGARYEGRPGELNYRVIDYQSYGVKIAEPAKEAKRGKAEAIPTKELWSSDDPKERALLQWRISIPLLVPVVALLAIPLSRVNPRQGRFFHLLPAMLIYILYLGLLIASRKSLEKERIPEWIGMWWVHLVFLITALGLMFGPDWMQKRRVQRAQA
ncbi:LPS export ABC transporter permease LptF [Hahella sp. CCB-MM4]|uniref:LPS export ABC transporter permease LptF n=1 Tax=Hahella sp. (strain CCB-MM4) TaxID=1926491 RepID=UPI000B9A1F09|nr:LPS export ABC transporter permease LptF [Hahella sp. CCB-MM4]OZG72509.1 LPS export ABC transporter permease LptF [Hahella sp. CCB-MM4]